MHLIKKMALAVSLLVASNFANAAVVVADQGDSVESNWFVDQLVDVGFFDQDTLFSLSADQFVDGVASNWYIPNPDGGAVYDIEILSMTFSQYVGGVWNTLFESDIASDSSVLFSSPLSAGDYKINVTGTGIGESGGRYGLHGEFTSAVPEPSIVALMLGGLGLVGFMARRRKTA